MSRLAVKEYLRSTIDADQAAITASTNYEQVWVFRQTPKFQKYQGSLLVTIGRVRSREKRLAGARTLGSKQVDYEIHIWLFAIDKDEQQGGDDFDVAADNLKAILRALAGTSGTVPITDPETGATSWLMGIGEEIEEDLEEPIQAKPEGSVRFFEAMVIHATEQITG